MNQDTTQGRGQRRTAGQVMVLSCLTLFVLALMVASGFAMSSAIHERIRIQSHADATAYSAAILSARAMNVTAYTNRTIAAVLVANMSVHAWMAIASETVAIHQTGALNFGMMAACEMDSSHCCKVRCYGVCCYVPDCLHAAMDAIVAIMHMMDMFDYGNKVQGKEQDFNDAVEALNQATIDLHKLQKASLKKAHDEISQAGTVLGALKSKNAPQSSYVDAVLRLNAGELACALEGSDFDDECQKVIGSAPSKADASERSKVMQSAANAARLNFHILCSNCTKSGHEDFYSKSDHLMDTQLNDDEEKHSFSSAAGINSSKFPPTGTAEAKTVGALTVGTMETKKGCENCKQTMPITSWVWSDENGGSHFPFFAHSGNHDKFKGYQQQDVCGDEACFVNFRASADKDIDFNQPSMYGGVTQDLSTMRHGGKGKWEIAKDDSARIRVKYGDGKEADFLLKPRDTGFAVAKAKVYYHQLGDKDKWQFAPNLFDPFWRAKLHFFKRAELESVLGTAGDGEGASIAGGSGPVEGVD